MQQLTVRHMTAPEYLIRLAVLLVGWEAEALRVAAERAVEQAQVQTRDFSAGPAVAVPVPPTDPPTADLTFYVQAANPRELARVTAVVDQALTAAGIVLKDPPRSREVRPIGKERPRLRGMGYDNSSRTLTVQPAAGPVVLDLVGAHPSGDGTTVLLATAGDTERREEAFVVQRLVIDPIAGGR